MQEITEQISWNPSSIFCSWFCMPLCKVEKIANCFISEGWLSSSLHCRNLDKLQVKVELIVLGAFVMIAGTVHTF
jgi:hypothetical protein